MGYSGQTYKIPCDKGGLSGNRNIDAVEAIQMIVGSKNLNLGDGGREKRGGTAHLYSTDDKFASEIRGLFDFTDASGVQHVIVADALGNVWADETTCFLTGMSTSNFFSFEAGNNLLWVTSESAAPKLWNGISASGSGMASGAADWATNPVLQFILHGYGNSERMWAINEIGVYASSGTDMLNFGASAVINIPIDTGGLGLVGGVEFQDKLFVFSRAKSYIINDVSTTTTDWGYETAAWDGGAASRRLIMKTPNDLVCMSDDGNIYSVLGVNQTGDYQSASISRPSFIHNYIADNVDLSEIAKFHGAYDPKLRALKIWVVRKSKPEADTCLVYFIDTQAWMIHDNENSPSGYTASCSAVVRKTAGDWRIYTGDYAGNVWVLEESAKADDGNGFYAGFKTPMMSFDNPRIRKRFDKVWIITQPKGAWDLVYKFWLDGKYQGTGTISLAGVGGALGSFVLATDVLGGLSLVNSGNDIGAVGNRLQLELYNSNASEDFFISQILVDHKQLGGGP
jgi:hypothetical protein